MILKEIIDILENWAPIENAEDFDNVGLLVGDPSINVNKALITIDTLENVIDEAIENKCDLIISFHPIIFTGLKNLTQKTYVERVVRKAIRNDINIYSIHTNLDNHPKGVNYQLSKQLSLLNTKILIKKDQSENGMGMTGELKSGLTELDFLKYVKEKMNVTAIKHSSFIHKKIEKIAVLGGSGSFAIEEAINSNVDCLLLPI